ncbi:hypothetical protein I302_104248 [Kwoniella bestiolae CBS 10118]|uniref:Uncharacterized protein n=1 Tax=Kwoniella bestiolae CBS 10118 TaxID=1296100 RepID=A0AAJ8K7K7_9TREE
MKEDKPGVWLEWEERNVRIDCRLAKFITFARFKKELQERQHQSRPVPAPNIEAEIPRKRRRRSTANYGKDKS